MECRECKSTHINKNGNKRGKPPFEGKQNYICVSCNVTDGWKVYPGFIPNGDQIACKTYMTRVEGENTRLRHYLVACQA